MVPKLRLWPLATYQLVTARSRCRASATSVRLEAPNWVILARRSASTLAEMREIARLEARTARASNGRIRIATSLDLICRFRGIVTPGSRWSDRAERLEPAGDGDLRVVGVADQHEVEREVAPGPPLAADQRGPGHGRRQGAVPAPRQMAHHGRHVSGADG